MTKPRLFFLVALMVLVGAVAYVLFLNKAPSPKHAQLRMLGYVGYDEPDFIAPLEKALDTTITVDTYVGGEQMYTKFTTAPTGTYDVIVLDAEYGQRLFADKRLISLDESLWHYDDLFARFKTGEPTRSGNDVYATVARWGSIGLVFNSTKLDPTRLATYDVLYDPDLAGKIGIYDWYLPNMGILSLSLGNKEPFNIDSNQLTQLQDRLLTLRQQVTRGGFITS